MEIIVWILELLCITYLGGILNKFFKKRIPKIFAIFIAYTLIIFAMLALPSPSDMWIIITSVIFFIIINFVYYLVKHKCACKNSVGKDLGEDKKKVGSKGIMSK